VLQDTRLEVTGCIRELIEEIRLVPKNGKLRVELYGELATLINIANENPRSKGTGGANNVGCGDWICSRTYQVAVETTRLS
jgi:hypothetical protein